MNNILPILDQFRQVLIQIATPHSTGTGFYLAEHDLIVTNEHVVRGNRSVIINSHLFPKQLAQVLFLDPKYDLAFLEAPEGDLPLVSLHPGSVNEGEKVLAIGHPFGLKFTATNGIISNSNHMRNNVRYVLHDAALNPGNSGGPLVDQQAQVIGINTFIIRDGNNIGFSLPSYYLRQAIDEFTAGDRQPATRCASCANIVFTQGEACGYCPHCGSKVLLPQDVKEYEPIGINKTIEDILLNLGHEVKLARIGPNLWEVIEGSAKVYLAYHEESGLIIGDSLLAQLPKREIGALYEFLLRENHRLENLSFSVKGNDIILSLIIYDRYLNVETGEYQMKRLFEKSDHYDDILVETYGAIWKE